MQAGAGGQTYRGQFKVMPRTIPRRRSASGGGSGDESGGPPLGPAGSHGQRDPWAATARLQHAAQPGRADALTTPAAPGSVSEAAGRAPGAPGVRPGTQRAVWPAHGGGEDLQTK